MVVGAEIGAAQGQAEERQGLLATPETKRKGGASPRPLGGSTATVTADFQPLEPREREILLL